MLSALQFHKKKKKLKSTRSHHKSTPHISELVQENTAHVSCKHKILTGKYYVEREMKTECI